MALSVGAFGSEVASLQRDLLAHGYEVPAAELERSFFGPTTRFAVRAYQQEHALAVTGVVDEDTRAAIAVAAMRGVAERIPDVHLAGGATDHGGSAETKPAARSDDGPAQSPPGATGNQSIRGRVIERTAQNSPLRVSSGEGTPTPGPALVDAARAVVPQVSAHQPLVQEALASMGRSVSGPLVSFLSARGIKTLADVLQAGGIGHLDGLPVAADDPAVRNLEAQARLSTLSITPPMASTLVRAGYESTRAIAAASREEFVTRVSSTVSEPEAIQLHLQAAAVTRLLDNVLANHLAQQANGV